MAGWEVLEVATTKRVEIKDITAEVTAVCARAAQRDGLLVVVCSHATAGLTLNEGEPKLWADLTALLERLIPQHEAYSHNRADDNADAHLRAMLLGHSVCVPVEGGRPLLGTWQRILLVELDGPRRRTLRAGVWG